LGFDEVVYLRQQAWKVFGQREIHGDPFESLQFGPLGSVGRLWPPWRRPAHR
jgi:hypothetical protein